MAVYINVTWCPYCRKFEKEVLSDPEVRKAMKDIIKVRVNPEDGQKENAIAFQYGVTGFPSFFVHPPQPSSTVRLYTGVAPAQFVGLLKKILK
jgi:thiol:disulfide interchange protein